MKTLITAAALAAGFALALPAMAQSSAPGTSVQTGAASNNAMSHGAMSNDTSMSNNMSNGAMSDNSSMSMKKKPAKKMAMKKHTDATMGMSGDAAMSPNASGVNGGNNTNTNTTAGH